MFKKIIVFVFLIILIFNVKLVFGKSLENIQALKEGEEVEVVSQVIVPPNILGKRYFYINGAQIYSHFKDFPDLKIGDKVKVTGEISKAYGEKRVKTSSKKDIKILSKGDISPLFFNLDEINKGLIGYLIKTRASIIEKTGPRLFLTDLNKKTREQIVYFKTHTNINTKKFNPGDKIEITGVLSCSNDKLELLPRFQKDLKIIKKYKTQSQKNSFQSKSFLGLDNYIWSICNSYKIYFIISSIILLCLLIYLIKF